jgi:hypothetical protein
MRCMLQLLPSYHTEEMPTCSGLRAKSKRWLGAPSACDE